MTLKIRFINQSFFLSLSLHHATPFFIFCLVELYRLESCFRKWKRQGRIIFRYRDDSKCIVFYCTAATLFLVLANHYGHDKEINKRINRSIRIAVWVSDRHWVHPRINPTRGRLVLHLPFLFSSHRIQCTSAASLS